MYISFFIHICSDTNILDIACKLSNKNYCTDTITFNISNCKVDFNGSMCTIIKNTSNSEFNVLDGQHRTKGCLKLYEMIKERLVNMKLEDLENIVFPIQIEFLSIAEAQNAFSQFTKGLKISTTRKEFFDNKSPYTKFLKDVINLKNSNPSETNKKPQIELTTNLENVNIDTILNWEYTFIDEDTTPTKISFILNDVEYDSIDKIPKKLEVGDYTIKFKVQDSKGLWSNEILKEFEVINNNIIDDKPLSLGGFHSIIIGTDGNLYSWGNNEFGQLGIGNTINQTKPVKVNLPNGVKPKSIALGYYHSMAIGEDGNIYAWGRNNIGQLGIGNSINQSNMVKVSLPNEVKPKLIETGLFHSVAMGQDGNIYVWGYNGNGQLGMGSVVIKNVPTKLSLPN